MYSTYPSQHAVAAGAYHARPQRREHQRHTSASSSHTLPNLPAAIPLPATSSSKSAHTKTSSNKINAHSSSSSKAYPPNHSLTVNTSRYNDSMPNYSTSASSAMINSQSTRSHKSRDKQPQQQQQQQTQQSSYRHIGLQPLAPHQQSRDSQHYKLSKRMQHLSYPLTGGKSVSSSLPQNLDYGHHPKSAYWYSEYPHYARNSPSPPLPNDGSGSSAEGTGGNSSYYVHSSQAYHYSSPKPQPQNIYPQKQHHSSHDSRPRDNHHVYPKSPHPKAEYSRHAHNYDQQQQHISRKSNPHHQHLHQGHNQYHGSVSPSVSGTSGFPVPMSLPDTSSLPVGNSGCFMKKNRHKKVVTFANPIAEFKELPEVCSMSAPVSSALTSGSILKRNSLTHSSVAGDHGYGSSSGGGLLAYEQSLASSSTNLNGSSYYGKSRRRASSGSMHSSQTRYPTESFYGADGVDSPDYEHEPYHDSFYGNSLASYHSSYYSPYHYDSRFSLSTDYLPLNEDYAYC
ncbi:hypothetical protein LPJ53_004102 [Coemansia erecta]|uniref:Uncharacterized protein n=1 Tax=Coemansia erecta TaxID=147472 RepID=A0A9W8CRR5_9FUNG|nr:hypothetical protein LPJ53_004102 [Coemansia erecta]